MADERDNDDKAGNKNVIKQVYEDALSGAAKEFGENAEGIGTELAKSGRTITRTINVLLAPFALLVWGYEKIGEYIETSLEEKLKNVPDERRQSPDPLIAGPTIEALRFAGSNEELRELFVTLLATSIDSETAKNAHPAFVEVIKQLSSDEAKILRFLKDNASEGIYVYPIIEILQLTISNEERFSVVRNYSDITVKASCSHETLYATYIDNLVRLNLVRIPESLVLSDSEYEEFESDEFVTEVREEIDSIVDCQSLIRKKYIVLTDFGILFLRTCVGDFDSKTTIL